MWRSPSLPDRRVAQCRRGCVRNGHNRPRHRQPEASRLCGFWGLLASVAGSRGVRALAQDVDGGVAVQGAVAAEGA